MRARGCCRAERCCPTSSRNQLKEAMLDPVADPERCGPAKRFVMGAQAAGVDPTDTDALNEFAERHNEDLAA